MLKEEVLERLLSKQAPLVFPSPNNISASAFSGTGFSTKKLGPRDQGHSNCLAVAET
jgi:hypothetical protein